MKTEEKPMTRREEIWVTFLCVTAALYTVYALYSTLTTQQAPNPSCSNPPCITMRGTVLNVFADGCQMNYWCDYYGATLRMEDGSNQTIALAEPCPIVNVGQPVYVRGEVLSGAIVFDSIVGC